MTVVSGYFPGGQAIDRMSDSPDLTYRLLGARFLRRQAKQLAEQLGGVCKADDSEFIHRARVASRRLRAALRMFRGCWRRKKMKRWVRQIRDIAQGLGSARDRDVEIEFLCGILSDMTDKACSPGIARLLVQVERQRESLQSGVFRAVDRLERSKTLERIQRSAKRVLASAPSSETIDYDDSTRRQTKQFIVDHLAELRLEQDSLDDPQDSRRHHAMRIAAKRLRYTLEIARPVYAGQLDDAFEATRKLQSLLGDVHDCDVWLQHLDAFSREECGRIQACFGSTARCARLEPGINYLRQERTGRRRQVFRELVEYWHKLEQRGVWDRLVQVVESDGRLPAAAASAPGSAAGNGNPSAPANGSAARLKSNGALTALDPVTLSH